MIKPILIPLMQWGFCLTCGGLLTTYCPFFLFFSLFFSLPPASDPASHEENTGQFKLQPQFLNVRKRHKEEGQPDRKKDKEKNGCEGKKGQKDSITTRQDV